MVFLGVRGLWVLLAPGGLVETNAQGSDCGFLHHKKQNEKETSDDFEILWLN